ncbi:MAG: prepilin peptidase [Syntrophorhabdales bacterium]|jgi:leader peptidase (prepilin peptidase)/N-methyltransferase
MHSFSGLLFFVLGAIIGSFLNVCIYRLPREKSIVTPGSSCTRCGEPISFYDNIPIVSYLILKGRCRRCGAVISGRYVAIELLTALLYMALYNVYGLSLELAVALLFVSTLIVISFIDLEFRIIPDTLSLGGVVAGLVLCFFRPAFNYVDAFMGIVLGGGVLWAIAFGYELLRKREGMGGGDIKLLAMIGSFCGIKGVLFSLVSGSLLGTLVGIPLMLIKHADAKYAIPFGPFLSFGAIFYVLAGDRVIYAFLSLISAR